MPNTALVFREGSSKNIVAIDNDLVSPDSEHFVVTLPDDIEHWRLSIDSDENLVIKFDGEDTATALASLLAEQKAAEDASED
jgi:hypothetical protein